MGDVVFVWGKDYCGWVMCGYVIGVVFGLGMDVVLVLVLFDCFIMD